jgi:hypothetical protein
MNRLSSSIASGCGRILLRLTGLAVLGLLCVGPASAGGLGWVQDGAENGLKIIAKALAASQAKGLQTVDPESLNPPAEIEFVPWFGPIPYDKCWKSTTEITCVAYLRTFQVGDGSLEGQGGEPLDWGIVCDQGYSLYQQFQNTWVIVRFYTLAGDIVSRYRIEIGDGTVYNSINGKAARVFFNDLFKSIWSTPGDPDTEIITIFGNDWSAATLKGKLLVRSYGAATFFPDGTWTQTGAHPLDAYFFGDPSGIAALCNYVK